MHSIVAVIDKVVCFFINTTPKDVYKSARLSTKSTSSESGAAHYMHLQKFRIPSKYLLWKLRTHKSSLLEKLSAMRSAKVSRDSYIHVLW